MLGISDAVLFGFLEMPLRGNRYILLLAAVLFILATQLIGTLLTGASLPDVRLAFLGLWIPAGVHALIAILLEKGRQRPTTISGS